MALRVPSFPVPGEHSKTKREADESVPDDDTTQKLLQAAAAGGEDAEVDERAPEEGASEREEPPDMMDLVDTVQEARARVSAVDLDAEGGAAAAGEAAAAFAGVLRMLARRLQLTPDDRDMLSDFEVVDHICIAMGAPAIAWKGKAMLTLCVTLPDMVQAHTINRGAFRDGGAVDALMDFLQSSTESRDEAGVVAASMGLVALCTANDGNKKEASRLKGDFNNDELVETNADYRTPLFKEHEKHSGMDVLLETLELFPESVPVQTNATLALRSLITDDDPRQASCLPSAVENRDRAVKEENFPAYQKAVERAMKLEASGDALLKLRDSAMLLLRELSCREDKIKLFVYQSKLLPDIEAMLRTGDPRLVRSSLSVIRAFAFSDELKEQLAVESDVAMRSVAAVQANIDNPRICEQAFGLFANLTMRKPHIAKRLNGPESRIVAVGQLVLGKHSDKPAVMASVFQTLRNVASQDAEALAEVQESGLFEELQELVVKHTGDDTWHSPVEVAKQFCREFRQDEGIRGKPKWNEFY